MTDLPDSIATVADDVDCCRCGHNLRGLAMNAECPECGSAVSDSHRPELLRFADPIWINRVRFGLLLKLYGFPVLFVVALLGRAFVGRGSGDSVKLWLGVLEAGAGACATYFVTLRESVTVHKERRLSSRRLARFLVFAWVGQRLFEACIAGSAVSLEAVQAIGLAGNTAAVFSSLAEWTYLRILARRVPDSLLERSATIIAILIVLSAPARITPKAPGSTPPRPPFAIASAMVLIGIAVFVWYISVLVRYRRALAHAAVEAANRNRIPTGGGSGMPQRSSSA